jgi:hypothetical protein
MMHRRVEILDDAVLKIPTLLEIPIPNQHSQGRVIPKLEQGPGPELGAMKEDGQMRAVRQQTRQPVHLRTGLRSTPLRYPTPFQKD